MSHRQVGDVIPGQLQGRLAADARLSVLSEGCEAIDLFKDGQEKTCTGQRFETAEVLIMLVKTADDQFCDIIGALC